MRGVHLGNGYHAWHFKLTQTPEKELRPLFPFFPFTTERLERERKNRIELLEKESTGERNVLNSRIEALQATVEKQAEQIAKLSQQLEHSYRQVQDIAVKAIEGPSAPRPAGHLYPSGPPDQPPRSTQAD